MTKNINKITLELDEVGNFLAKFAENSDHVYWISSHDFKSIRFISPSYERIWGRSRKELYKNPELWITYIHPDDVVHHHPIHEMAQKIMTMGDKARYSEHYRIIRPDGEIRWIMDNGFPLYDDQGFCYGVTGIAIDVTEQKRQFEELKIAKEKAEIANNIKSHFIANMSHDIRTPLSGIVGISKLLEDEVKNAREKQHARWINESGEQLLGLLNSILDIVSAENLKETDVVKAPFDLRQTILDVCRLELPAVKLKNLNMYIDFDPQIPQYIISDRIKLHRILLNFLGNAIKFTEEGKITLQIKQRSSNNKDIELEFNVSDTGIGIDKQAQEKVFDRFFRADPSYKGIYEGHGVGLHIAKKYADLLGGSIHLTSALNKGSTFSFHLNAVVEEDSPSIAACFNSRSLQAELDCFEITHPDIEPNNLVLGEIETKSYLPNVLLVEDNIIALRLVESIAKQAGCQITSATDGEKALELATSTDFDLIISDIGLPGISGTELTERIRAFEQSLNKKQIPIVGLTAHALDIAEKECLASGMNKIYTKPINLPTMQTIINSFIASSNITSFEQNTLGRELPETEKELFILDHLPLLDTEKGIATLGSKEILKEIVTMMIKEAIPTDETSINKAYTNRDWDTVEKLAHKLKSGALYCGAIKMQRACQYIERYYKAGHRKLLEPLYHQLVAVLNETRQFMIEWLQNPVD